MSRREASRPNVFARLWLKAFASGRRKAVLAHRPRVRLQLEHLEDRVVPATLDVTNLNATGAGSLFAAFQTANTNGQTNTIDINVAGIYNIGQVGALQVFANATTGQSGLSLTVQNTSGGTVAISGDNMTRVLDINPNDINGGATPSGTVLGAVTITGVTIENGLAQPGDTQTGSGGGIRDQGPVDLTLNNDIITNNSASADGGGVSMEQPGSVASTKWMLNLNNTTVTNNHAGDAGGGVEEDGTGIVNVTGSTIADNTCLNQGAGIWLDNIGTGTATLTVTNSIVENNAAGMLGGGIGNAGTSAVTITGSTIANNFTTGDGGGFANQQALGTSAGGTLTVTNSLFLDNSAALNGGGIEEGGGLTISNSEVKGNAAGVNGAMPVGTTGGGAANTVKGSGGGLFVDGGALTLTASTLADNTATINGGGIELDTTAASTITNSTIVGNTGLNSAGGTNGGGIDDAATGTVALVNDTITNNFADNGGGIFFAGATGLTLQNTILAQNLASTTGPDFDFTGTPTGVDLGGNLIGIGDPAIFTAGTTQQGTVATPLNPMVAGLANNGGPLVGAPSDQITLETEALLPGSTAIGTGVTTNAPTTDERGAPRINTIDIGAFQFQDATLLLTIGTASTIGLNTTETVTVTATNNSANPLPADTSTLTVTASSGLNIGGTQTFALNALPAGQSQSFSFQATGVTAGAQTLTATVTSPDTNPTATTARTTVTVSTTSPPGPASAPTLNTPPLLAFIDSLLGGVETLNSNGTVTVTDKVFGITLFVSTYNSNGNLISVTIFGFNVTALFELL